MQSQESSVSKTSAQEIEDIRRAQRREAAWWQRKPALEDPADIETLLESGKVIRVPDQGAWYRISEKTPEEFRVLEQNTFDLLEYISKKWAEKLQKRGTSTDNIFLVITSLARTKQYQEKLARQGYPAIEEGSTHTKLGAFDIAIEWFQKNRPELLEALHEVLEELSNEEKINFIEEPTVGVYHIASNPLL